MAANLRHVLGSGGWGEPQKRLLSQKEAAAYLGISYWALRDLLFRGVLPYLRIGRRILVDRLDLENYIQKAKIHPGA